MRALLFTLLALAPLEALASPPDRPLAKAREVTWLGVDYTGTRFVSTTDFADEQQVVGYYPTAWNTLVVEELLEKMEQGLGCSVQLDVDPMLQHNQACTTDQIVRALGSTRESHLDREAVDAMVQGWPHQAREGVGLGIVMESMVKIEEKGCAWVVFVDLSDKDVLSAERRCEAAAGFGFRNYWFRPVKTLLTRELDGLARRARSAH